MSPSPRSALNKEISRRAKCALTFFQTESKNKNVSRGNFNLVGNQQYKQQQHTISLAELSLSEVHSSFQKKMCRFFFLWTQIYTNIFPGPNV